MNQHEAIPIVARHGFSWSDATILEEEIRRAKWTMAYEMTESGWTATVTDPEPRLRMGTHVRGSGHGGTRLAALLQAFGQFLVALDGASFAHRIATAQADDLEERYPDGEGWTPKPMPPLGKIKKLDP